MKNNKFVLLLAVTVSVLLAGPLFAQSKFSSVYKDVNKTLKGETKGPMISQLTPEEVTNRLVKAAKKNDKHASLRITYSSTLKRREKDEIVSNALAELNKEENVNYDALLYFYDLAQKNGEINVSPKVKADILGKFLHSTASDLNRRDFVRISDAILEYIKPNDISHFYANYLLIASILGNNVCNEVIDVADKLIEIAGSPDNLRVPIEPSDPNYNARNYTSTSMLGFWAQVYDNSKSHTDNECETKLIEFIVKNKNANVEEKIYDKNGERKSIWQVVAQNKPSRRIKTIFGLP